AMHLITHEQPDWVWTTFWWSPNPTEIEDRPDWVAKDPKLRYFNMRVTMNIGKEPVFNPYLEATFEGGSKSHCIACHRNAAVQVTGDNPEKPTLSFQPPAPADVSKQPDCRLSVCTNFIWSIARHAVLHQ